MTSEEDRRNCYARTDAAQEFNVIETEEFYGWESGHLARLDGRSGDPHHRVDYIALFLRKKCEI